MEDYGEFYDDEGEYYDGEYDEHYRAEMYSKQKLLDALMNSKRMNLDQLSNRCVYPLVFGESFNRLAELVAFCLIVNFTSCLPFLPKSSVPLTSLCLGLLVIYRWFESLSIYLFGLTLIGYVVLLIISNIARLKSTISAGFAITVIGVCYTICLQFFVLSANDMTRLRGALMIIVMKLISLGFDLDSASITEVPIVVYYFSYIFSVSTVIFGPWLSFKQHKNLFEQKDFKEVLLPSLKGLVAVAVSFLCLCYSACFIDWLFLDAYEYYSKWIIAYRDAQSFRFSHYFVCFLSEATVLLSGYSYSSKNADSKSSEFYVTRPLPVELPRSLVDVVVSWNIPMHNWLKTYAFRRSSFFGKFLAVLSTYTASSLLHGFNFQLSAVLLSLGFYTYAEHVLREKLARGFSSCIRARKCSEDCQHTYKKHNPLVLLVNFCFFLLSLFHLAYLGMVFDSGTEQESGYSMAHTLEKWGEFGFLSHFVAMGTFIFAIII